MSLAQWHQALQTAFTARAVAGKYQGGTVADNEALDSQAMHLLTDTLAASELARSEGISTDQAQLYADWLNHASGAEQREAEQHVGDTTFKQDKAQQELRSELISKLVPLPEVTNEEDYAFYVNNPALFARAQPEVHVREIVTSSLSTAQQVESLLNQGRPFGSMASMYSVDAAYYRQRGGDTGWLGIGAMPPEWVAHALPLSPGQIGSPFELWGSYYILQGVDAPDYQPAPFASVQIAAHAALVAKLQDAALNTLIARHENTMTIVVMDGKFADAVSAFRASLK